MSVAALITAVSSMGLPGTDVTATMGGASAVAADTDEGSASGAGAKRGGEGHRS